MEFEENTDELPRPRVSGEDVKPSSELSLHADDPLIKKIAERKKEVTIYDIQADPFFDTVVFDKTALRASAVSGSCAPIPRAIRRETKPVRKLMATAIHKSQTSLSPEASRKSATTYGRIS